jgi:chemotaxis response regulator CheB
MTKPSPSSPAKVLVINDSPVARAVTAAVVGSAADFHLAGQATSGLDGVEQAARLRPDMVLLDMHMPDINGVEVTRRILALRPTRILICTATIRRNTSYLFDALKAGALDYTRTPVIDARPGARVSREAVRQAGRGLLGKMRTVLGLPLHDARHEAPAPEPGPRPWAQSTVSAPAGVTRPARIVGIGCSTGGPSALSTLLAALPRGIAAPVLVSQHIEEEFAAGLADWLARESGHPVTIARAGEPPAAGHVYLARGGRSNLLLAPGWRLGYEPSGAAIYYPNIDRMLASLAAVAGRSACGVILTGLGDDGAVGMAALKGAGAKLLVQDPATAAVDGMPGAVLRRGVLGHGHAPADLARLIGAWAGSRP